MRAEADHPIGGRKTVRTSDDNPRGAWDCGAMPAQAIALDTSISDPIAALRRVGGVTRNRRMRNLAIAVGFGAAAAVVAVAAPRVIETCGHALARALHADSPSVIGGIAFELLSFAG